MCAMSMYHGICHVLHGQRFKYTLRSGGCTLSLHGQVLVCMLQCLQMHAQCCCPDCCGCLVMQRGRCTFWFGHSEAHAHANSATSCPLLISYTLLYFSTLQIQHLPLQSQAFYTNHSIVAVGVAPEHSTSTDSLRSSLYHSVN